jgi:DNA (cytosine-5)-methyltransferase 1
VSVYYNENDRGAAEWLRNLVAAGLLPAGDVDERDIRDVRGYDVRGYEQCHFFAGVGGWPYACQLAGWRSPIWTGSCPCQPLSVAGRRQGDADKRHLWPAFQRLIAECAPSVVVGEQVASTDGREWLAGVRADLEDAGYACGCADLPACGVGAPHLRRRYFWGAVADAEGIGRAWRNAGTLQGYGQSERQAIESERRDGSRLGDTDRAGLAERRSERGDARAERATTERADGSGMDNAYRAWQLQPEGSVGELGRWPRDADPWRNAIWLACHDGKARRAKPGLPLLVNGISGRVAVSRTGQTGEAALSEAEVRWISRTAAWRGFGNAIVPQVAAQFLLAMKMCAAGVGGG